MLSGVMSSYQRPTRTSRPKIHLFTKTRGGVDLVVQGEVEEVADIVV